MSETPSENARRAPAKPAAPVAAGGEPPRVYFRTTYPLNPGIPHHLDFPRDGK